MLNVGALREGYVLDHIKAGKAMTIYVIMACSMRCSASG